MNAEFFIAISLGPVWAHEVMNRIQTHIHLPHKSDWSESDEQTNGIGSRCKALISLILTGIIGYS